MFHSDLSAKEEPEIFTVRIQTDNDALQQNA